jgi:hypothetical protein
MSALLLAARTFSLMLSTHSRLSWDMSFFMLLGPAMPSELSPSVELIPELDLERPVLPDTEDGVSEAPAPP